jgi:hypothetical protein
LIPLLCVLAQALEQVFFTFPVNCLAHTGQVFTLR